MASSRVTVLRDEKLATSQPHVIDLFFNVTAGVVSLLSNHFPPVIAGEVATPFTQAAANALLELDSDGDALSTTSTDEIAATTAFGTTAMGVDAVGVLLMTGGQIKRAIGMKAMLLNGTAEGATGTLGNITNLNAGSDAVVGRFVKPTTSAPNTLTEALYVTPAGNLAARAIITGLDAATGVLHLQIYVEWK